MRGSTSRHAGRGLEVLLALVQRARRQAAPPFSARSPPRQPPQAAPALAAPPGHRRGGLGLSGGGRGRGPGHRSAARRQTQFQEEEECAVAIPYALGEDEQEGTARQGFGDQHHPQRGLDDGSVVRRQDAGRAGLHRGPPEAPQSIPTEQEAYPRERSVRTHTLLFAIVPAFPLRVASLWGSDTLRLPSKKKKLVLHSSPIFQINMKSVEKEIS